MNNSDKCQLNDCVYHRKSKQYFVNHWGFIGCMIVVTIIAAIFFIAYNNSYQDSQQRIVDAYKQLCDSTTVWGDIAANDTVFIYRDFEPIITQQMQSVTNLLDLHTIKSQNDFTILTVWASVLMIVFLIFSIYSMFKIDEIQKQGRESLRQIDEIYSAVRKKSENLDDAVEDAMRKIENSITQKINEFTIAINQQSSTVKQKLEAYQKTVTETAENNQQFLNTLVNLIKETPNVPSTKTVEQQATEGQKTSSTKRTKKNR